MKIGNTILGDSVFIIAELSCNHRGNIDEAIKMIHEAKKAGVNAIKIQTYTPENMTIDCDNDDFSLKNTIWEKYGNLFNLYKQSFTPISFYPILQKEAEDLGMEFFTSVFDPNTIDELEKNYKVTCYKIASFEITDKVLLHRIALTKKPVIISSGMATEDELDEAVQILKGSDIAILKCTSEYPASLSNANLNTIPYLKSKYPLSIIGISDHTLGDIVPIASVSLGAQIIEKHFTLSKNGSPDDAFSMIPDEWKNMIDKIRQVEQVLGKISFSVPDENKCKLYRRSLFVVEDIKKGEKFTSSNIRSIRPSTGLDTKYYWNIIDKYSNIDLKKGTPMKLEFID